MRRLLLLAKLLFIIIIILLGSFYIAPFLLPSNQWAAPSKDLYPFVAALHFPFIFFIGVDSLSSTLLPRLEFVDVCFRFGWSVKLLRCRRQETRNFLVSPTYGTNLSKLFHRAGPGFGYIR